MKDITSQTQVSKRVTVCIYCFAILFLTGFFALFTTTYVNTDSVRINITSINHDDYAFDIIDRVKCADTISKNINCWHMGCRDTFKLHGIYNVRCDCTLKNECTLDDWNILFCAILSGFFMLILLLIPAVLCVRWYVKRRSEQRSAHNLNLPIDLSYVQLADGLVA